MGKRKLHRGAFILVLSIATFVMALSMLALSPVTTTLMAAWHVSFAQVEWLTTVFLLVMCLSMLVSPWLFNRIGFHRLILLLLACFMVGTLLLALSPRYFLALVGRVLEAVALGAMFPLYQSALLVITTGPAQETVMGIAGAVMSLAIVGGPAIAELALTVINWRTFYCLLVVITIIISLGSFRWVTNVVPVQRRPFDWRSIIYSLGIFGLLYLLNTSWSGRLVPLLMVFVVSLLLLVAFFWRQLHSTRPLLQIRALRYGRFDLCLLLSGVAYSSLVGLTVLLPLFYRQILLERGLKVSLALLVPALVLVLVNLATSRLTDWLGNGTVMMVGMVILTGSFLLFVVENHSLTSVKLVTISCLTAIGTGLVMMPATTQGATFLPSALVAHGITIITVTRQLLGSLGTALLTLLLLLAPGRLGFVWAFSMFMLMDLVVLGMLVMTLGGKNRENKEN